MSSDGSGSSRDSRPAEADRANQDSDGARERRATPEERAASAENSPGTGSGGGQRQSGAGESIGRRLDNAQATLSRSGPKAHLTLLVGLFGLVGLGIGVTGSILAGTVGGSGFAAQLASGLVSAASLVVALFLGIAIAAVGGLRVATDLGGVDREAYLTSFVGNATGYVVMSVVAIVLIGTPSNTGFGDLLLALIVLGLIAGGVGCGASALHRRVIGRAA